MSKQHLADMLQSMARGNDEEAKAHFSKYASEKTREILSRGEAPDGTSAPEPEITPAPIEDVNKPDGDSTTT